MKLRGVVLAIGVVGCGGAPDATTMVDAAPPCSPFDVTLPEPVYGHPTALNTGWGLLVGSEGSQKYIRLHDDGTFDTPVPVTSATAARNLAWHDNELVYVASDGTNTFLQFLDADGTATHAGNPYGAPSYDGFVNPTGDGYDVAFHAMTGQVAFAHVDSTGSLETAMPVNMPCNLEGLTQYHYQPLVLWMCVSDHGHADIWTGSPSPTLPIASGYVSLNVGVAGGVDTAVIWYNEMLFRIGGDTKGHMTPQPVLAVGWTGLWQVIDFADGALVEQRLDDNFATVSSSMLATIAAPPRAVQLSVGKRSSLVTMLTSDGMQRAIQICQ